MRTIIMLDEEGIPFNRTYPRRAGNLVKKGRAQWVDLGTIRMTSSTPSQDLEDDEMREGKDYFTRSLEFISNSQIDPLIKNDQVIRLFEACKGTSVDDILAKVTETISGEVITKYAIDAINNLDVPPEVKLSALTDIAKSSAFSVVQNMGHILDLVRTVTGADRTEEE